MSRLWREHRFFCLLHMTLPILGGFLLLYHHLNFPWKSFSGCLMRGLLHLYCPLCGGTRSLEAVLRLDFASAWRYHPLLPIGLLLFLILDAVAWIRFFRGKKTLSILPQKGYYFFVALLLVFFVWRNLQLLWGIDPIGELGLFWNGL